MPVLRSSRRVGAPQVAGTSVSAPRCSHSRIDVEQCRKIAINPSSWMCTGCHTTDDLWLCLSCGAIVCVRQEDNDSAHCGHFETHRKRRKHTLYMQLNTDEKLIKCFGCTEDLDGSVLRGETVAVQKAFANVESLDFSSQSPSRHARERWHKVQSVFKFAFFTPREIAKRRKLDILQTSMTRWRGSIITKAFNSWMAFRYLAKNFPDLIQDDENDQSTAVDVASTDTEGNSMLTVRLERLQLAADDLAKMSRANLQKTVRGCVGLRNLGNTCYMNSVLQLLSNSNGLRDALCYFFPHRSVVDESDHRSLSDEVSDLFGQMWSGNRTVISPDSMLNTVWRLLPAFSGFKQQDSEEFLRSILSQFSKEACDNPKLKSSLDSLFSGELVTTITCRRCGFVSRNAQQSAGIFTVDIPSHLQGLSVSRSRSRGGAGCPLQDCLDHSWATEVLEGDNKYFCEKCQMKQIAERRTLCANTKQYLILHVNRTSWSVTGTRKLQSHVTVPLHNLCLDKWLDTENGSNGSESSVYHLVALVEHQGSGMQQGHYVAFCRNVQTNCWMQYNDAKVSYAGEDEVRAAQAYLLCYEKGSTRVDEPVSEPMSVDSQLKDTNEVRKRPRHAY